MPVLSPADNDSGATASPAHVRTEFELTVHAPYFVAFPLFGPDGERSWAGPDWNPQFVHPNPAADIQGTVFTVKHGAHEAVWVNTVLDVEGRRIQYAYFISDVMVTTINLTFLPLDSVSTKVAVIYERTALNVAANEVVQQFGAADRARGTDWEKAINAYLQKHP
ncbi:MAG: hypothetical protein JO275_08885 [Verrucomicrobia bacterium]|nr:hypothetical protein [Verrucomicrobiota bacterium]